VTSTPLAQLTTLQVGGPARLLLTAHSRDELINATLETWNSREPWVILGGGSNTIFADDGFDGTVIHVASRGIERLNTTDDRSGVVAPPELVRVHVAAGEPWDDLVAWSVAEGLAGLEALSGIPGSTGAAPIQNIGAYGQELAQSLLAVEFLDAETEEISWIPARELGLGYRDSIFKRGRLGVILTVELGLFPADAAELANARADVLLQRAAKGMVLNPADRDTASVGSFFVNPIVTENFARGLPQDAPRWPLQNTDGVRILPLDSDVPPLLGPTLVKLSAAWLIEKAGVTKGYRVPGSGAAISSKHTLAITNTGTATANDVIGLARYVQAMVQSHFGIILQPEPNIYGLDL
jgi:UDP-N-acetylmuramate dehydrogenase